MAKLLDFFWYDVTQGIRSFVRWFPIIWKDRDWDWVFLARMMERKLTWMADNEEKNGHHLTSLRDAHRQRVCSALLRRMIADDYYENAEKAFGCSQSAAHHCAMMEKQDLALLGKMLGKYMKHWWD